ncbi:MAG TPA: phosphoglycerate kinase [Candidatus Thermoplasmatota archaeon]|nr:phosphoglycerate kinase [Candidatus Thermoplasmatota archaeon]
MKEYNTLDDFNVSNKTVLLRVDFNMPLDKKTLEITDDTRIRLALPTIKELLDKQAKIVILAHQGKQGSWDFTSMQRHAKLLQNLLGKPVTYIDDVFGQKAITAIKSMTPGSIVFLDNVRKFPGETDKKKPEEHAQTPLVQTLAPLADYYVNDAFAAAHRAQCSLTGFAAVLPSAAGRLLEKELTSLEKVVKNPEKPAVFLFGGAKFSDVVVTIDRVLSNKTADTVLLTGLPANAFLKAKGIPLGKINEEAMAEEGTPELFDHITKVSAKYPTQIHLPVDFAIEKNGKRHEIKLSDLPVESHLFDIGERTIQQYSDILRDAKTVFLSGPCGVFENPLFQKGTKEIFTTVAHSKAFSIAGGGHTIAALDQLHLNKNISHISTGGGALEKFMMGDKLPVVEALKQSKQHHLIKVK